MFDDRSGLRAHFGFEGERVSLQRQHVAVRGGDLIFVRSARRHIRREDFPHARIAAQPHHMAPPIPEIEVANNRHPARIRRPDCEMHAVGALMVNDVRAEFVEQAQVRAFGDVVIIHWPKHRSERVWVFDVPFTPAVAGPVYQRLAFLEGNRAFEKPRRMPPLQRAARLTRQRQHFERVSVRHKRARGELATGLMHAHHGERIIVLSIDDRLHNITMQPGVGLGLFLWCFRLKCPFSHRNCLPTTC